MSRDNKGACKPGLMEVGRTLRNSCNVGRLRIIARGGHLFCGFLRLRRTGRGLYSTGMRVRIPPAARFAAVAEWKTPWVAHPSSQRPTRIRLKNLVSARGNRDGRSQGERHSASSLKNGHKPRNDSDPQVCGASRWATVMQSLTN